MIGGFGRTLEQEVDAASAAITAGVPYLSAAHDPQSVEALLALEEEARSADALVIAGVSWSPGVTSLLAKAAAEALDEVRKVRIAWVVSPAGPGGREAALRALRALFGYAVVFEDGAWHREQAGTRSEEVFFPEPAGWRTTRLCLGAEASTLPRWLPGVGEVVVKGGLTEAAVDRAARGLARLAGLASPARRERLALVSAAALAAVARRGGARIWSAARVDVDGSVEGRSRTLTYGFLDQIASLSSVPVVVVATMVVGGAIKGAGAFPVEAVIDPPSFFAALAERGMRVARLDR